MLRTGLTLGAVGPGSTVYRLVPVYSYVDVHWKPGLVVALVVFFLAGRSLHRLLGRISEAPSEARLAAKLSLWFLAIVFAVALIDGGISRVWRPFVLLKDTDYIGGVEHVRAPREFLRHYAARLPELPDHCRTHPPGPILFLWTVKRVFAGGPAGAALATILFAALSVPAVLLLAGELLDRRRAVLATFLFLAAPSIVLFTATCMDAVFLVFFAWTFTLLWLGRRRRPWLLGALGGIAASLAAFFTFSAAVLALWAIIVWTATFFFDRKNLNSTTATLAAAALVSLGFYAALAAFCGYHLFDVLRAAVAEHHAIMSGGGHETLRQSLHLAVANLVAFGFGCGAGLVALTLVGGGRTPRGPSGGGEDSAAGAKKSPPLRLFVGCFAATLIVTAALPLYTLEVERIWLFFVPLLAITAAGRLDPDDPEFAPVGMTAYALQATQTILAEVFLCTLW